MTVTASRSQWIAELDRRPLVIGAVVVACGYLPLTLLGPGTDLDVGSVYQSGRAILEGGYEASRPPGAPVHEFGTGLLHAIGGSFLANLASVVAAVVTALGVTRLVQREGGTWAGWFGLAVILNPFVWIAGTSMVDFLWATAFVLVGANLQLSRRLPAAAVCYALAAGCRASTLLVVGAFIVADMWGDPGVRRRLVTLGAAVAVLTVLIYLPPLLQLGSDISRSAPQTAPWYVQLGRFGAKNIYFFGPVALVLLASVAVRRWRDLLGSLSASTVARAGLIGFVAVELLFLRFPWKLAHLIPAFVCVLVILGAARLLGRRGLAVLIASQLLLSVVALNVAQPDQPDDATGGRVSIELLEGPLLRDVRCRLDADRSAYRAPEGVGALLDTWACVVPWSE